MTPHFSSAMISSLVSPDTTANRSIYCTEGYAPRSVPHLRTLWSHRSTFEEPIKHMSQWRIQSRGKLRKYFRWQLSDWNIYMHCLTNALKIGFNGREDHNRLPLFQPQCKSFLARKRSLDKDQKIMLSQWVGKARYWEVCHLKKRKVGSALGLISQKSQ